jgi:hypothetical protein
VRQGNGSRARRSDPVRDQHRLVAATTSEPVVGDALCRIDRPGGPVGQKHHARPAGLKALVVRHVRALPTAQQDQSLLERLAGLVRLWVRAVLVGLARLSRLASLAALVRLQHPQVLADPPGLPPHWPLRPKRPGLSPCGPGDPVRLFRLAVPEGLGSLTDPQDQNIRRSGGLRQKQSQQITGVSSPR